MDGPQSERTSSFHLYETFSSESGVSTAKQMRMTCDCAYESGRSRCAVRRRAERLTHFVLLLARGIPQRELDWLAVETDLPGQRKLPHRRRTSAV